MNPPAALERHLTEYELALRWRVSLRTMQRWRREGLAPPHLMVGRSSIFPLAWLIAFEAARQRGERDG